MAYGLHPNAGPRFGARRDGGDGQSVFWEAMRASMAVSQRLDLRQTQSLVMTPQLQQAIKLLQLSNLELGAYVEQALEENPLLERAAPAEPPAAPETLDPAPARGDEDNLDDRAGETAWDGAPPTLADWGGGGGHGPGSEGEDDAPTLEQRLGEAPSLRAHLLAQIGEVLTGAPERAIATALIDSLDENGYLTTPVAELATLLGVAADAVEAVRQRLLGLDPAGVFATTLRECLACQLALKDRLDPAMAALLDNLELLAERDFARLESVCGVDREDLAEMAAEIRALDPRPARGYGGAPSQTVIPDILMAQRPDGSFALELNPETLPRVLVNNRYHARISAHARTKAEKSFITEHLQSANWLVRALDQRAHTILKVAGEIVRGQQLFFLRGVTHLRPLTLREVAEAIEMHESTVSRVTANKYIATPRGIYELKYFFTAAIPGTGGSSHSAEAVRHRIKALIEAEPPDGILSDDKLVALLRAEGIDIARRTVAKYREGMRIPPSTRRRREKTISS